jgi:hypothetical protein
MHIYFLIEHYYSQSVIYRFISELIFWKFYNVVKIIIVRIVISGIKYMTSLPDIVIIIDQQKECTAIQECITLGIPTICFDTDCNPESYNHKGQPNIFFTIINVII